MLSDANAEKFRYSTVQGFFLQDEPDTDPSTFDYTKSDFGLLCGPNDDEEPSQSTSPWEQLKRRISDLNCQSTPSVRYKLFYLVQKKLMSINYESVVHYLHLNQGRHGEGVHNVANDFYENWDVCPTL